ncbi:MAG: hypothetical protein R2755_23700 [Acidimicrobiales bacterium]
MQYPPGGWDLRAHNGRVVTVNEEVLGRWAQLFDEPGTPALEARLFSSVTTSDLGALDILSTQRQRLSHHVYSFTQGLNETNAKRDGTIRWETGQPGSWDEGAAGLHFTVATPLSQQPRPQCRNAQDYDAFNLELLPAQIVPRTNYQRDCDRDTYVARLDHWNGRPFTDHWRAAWRAMVDAGTERSLHAALVPPGPAHVNAIHASFDARIDNSNCRFVEHTAV